MYKFIDIGISALSRTENDFLAAARILGNNRVCRIIMVFQSVYIYQGQKVPI